MSKREIRKRTRVYAKHDYSAEEIAGHEARRAAEADAAVAKLEPWRVSEIHHEFKITDA